MPYVPNPTQATEPVESREVLTAAREFRELKGSVNTRIAALTAADATLQSKIDAEAATRAAADSGLNVRTTALEQLAFNGGTPGAVVTKQFTATASQTTFVLDFAPISVAQVSVYLQGIYQHRDTFSVSGANVVLSTGVEAGTLVEITANVPLLLGETSADLVEYLPAGAGAVATDVQSKLRESVSVKDFLCDDGVPVQGNGIHDDYTGIAKAIAYAKLTGAHIAAGARDTFYLGTFPNTTGASKFIIDFDNFGFHTNGCKFTVTYNADPVLAGSAKMTIFKIFNASNWTFGDFECEADYCERIGTQQGVTAIWVENTTLATNTGTIGVLRGLRLYATLLVTTTDVALRHRGIIAKLLFNNGGYYNLNCASNGDGVRANIHSNDLVRSYICYGVDDHDVKIYSTNHLKFTDVVVARLSNRPTTRNTTGLKIKYSCPSDLSSSAAITIEHQDIADSGSIENIYIDFDVVKSNPANPTINFASFDITSSPVLRTSTNCVTDNIRLRGKTNSTTPMVIGSAIGGVNGENISRLYVQRHLLNGIANFKRFIVKDSETRYLARSNAAAGMSLNFNVSELKFTPNWGLMTVWGANNPGASADEYIIRQYFVLFSVPSTGSTNPLSNTVIATQTAGSLSPTITFPAQTNTFDFAVNLNNYTHANRQCSATLEIYRVL